MKSFKKIICGVSGGVDSSVAAYLLKKKGYEVIGVYMRNWDQQEDDNGYCSVDKDAEDAEYVCGKIGIPFQEVNFVKEYWNGVFMEFVEEYQRGFTPNPDILCNKKIKFDAFYSFAIERMGTDAIATGHYANSSFGTNLEYYEQSKNVHLLRSVDFSKDQTFFLSQIPQEALRKTMFPLGRLSKSEVKKIAASTDFKHIARKPESMGICFIGENNYQRFITNYIKPSPGNFIDIETNEIIAKHKGIHLWTVGQRCAIPGKKHAYFVQNKRIHTNDMFVAPGTHHPSLYSHTLMTDKPYWIHSKPVSELDRFYCLFCFQHRNPLTPCMITETDNGLLNITLDTPLRALVPGQYSVFYDNNICLGSAKIIKVGPSLYANR